MKSAPAMHDSFTVVLARLAPSPETPMDATTLLKNDHDVVEELPTDLAGSTSRAVRKCTGLLEEIPMELKAHTAIAEMRKQPGSDKA